MHKEIQFFRCHLTEEAARGAALNDLEAFKAAFPGAITPMGSHLSLEGITSPEGNEYREYIMRERYADYGLDGCIIRVSVHTDVSTLERIDTWLRILNTGIQIESRTFA